jgi:hypothetical protein
VLELEAEVDVEVDVEVEVLFEDCVRAGSGEIPCARLAAGDNVKKSIEAAAIKCTRPKEHRWTIPPEPNRPLGDLHGCFYQYYDTSAQNVGRHKLRRGDIQ